MMRLCIVSVIVTMTLVASNARAGDNNGASLKEHNDIHPAEVKKEVASTAPNEGDAHLKQDKGPVLKKKTKKKKTEKKSATATFVDRDGDGINDGKEHRFRSKKQKSKKASRRQMMRKKGNEGTTKGR